jgi:hypothetical protein
MISMGTVQDGIKRVGNPVRRKANEARRTLTTIFESTEDTEATETATLREIV